MPTSGMSRRGKPIDTFACTSAPPHQTQDAKDTLQALLVTFVIFVAFVFLVLDAGARTPGATSPSPLVDEPHA
jgi:hypothetical protein